jgi:chromosome partitioning protein
VLFIDADKQETASTWKTLRLENDAVFRMVQMAREKMANDAMDLARGYDFTIIDGPPHADAVSRSCIAAADLVALPIEPGGASRWSSDLTVRQVQEAQEFKPSLKCGFVVSRKITGTVIGREARVMAAEVGIPVFETEIENRTPFNEALTMGKTIFEWAPNSAAAREIQALTHELLDVFNEQKLHAGTETRSRTATG